MEQMPKTANFPNEIKFKLAKMPAQGVCVCVCVRAFGGVADNEPAENEQQQRPAKQQQ